MIRKELLITGCGRSGTLYATEVWRSLGLDIRHERPVPPNGVMGNDGMASWYMTVDDPDPPFGPGGDQYSFNYIIHQVRHPLKVIASVAQFILRMDPKSRAYIERNCVEVRLTEQQRQLDDVARLILQAALYWYYWNQLAEVKANATVQVETLPQALPDLCQQMGLKYCSDSVENIPNTINRRQDYVRETPWVISWEHIRQLDEKLYTQVLEQAKRYGY